MFIIANHSISDPEKFWSLAKATPVPPPLELLCVFPASDGKKGTCLWKAASLESVKEFVEPLTGSVSRNEYMIVEAANAVGLPK